MRLHDEKKTNSVVSQGKRIQIMTFVVLISFLVPTLVTALSLYIRVR